MSADLSRGGVDDQDQELENAPANLVRKHKTDLLASTGRGLRLHHHLFRDFREALDVGVANPTPDLDTMSASDKFSYDTFLAIKKRVVDIEDRVIHLGGTPEVAKQMHDAGNNDRDVMVNGIKNDIHTWAGLGIPADYEDENARGYKNPICASYIAPSGCDPANPDVLKGLINEDPMYPQDYEHWPRICWLDQAPIAANLHLNFLTNATVARGMRYILYGKKAAGRAPGANDKTKRSRAYTHNINKPTFNMIVYTIILLHFSLSGNRIFRLSGGIFDYREFYYNILKYIKGSLNDDERKAILAWYRQRVFPKSAAAMEATPSVPAKRGTAEIMAAQKRARTEGTGEQ